MAMPRPAPAIVRKPHGAHRVAESQTIPRSTGVMPQEDQCLGNYTYCSNNNPTTPCLTYSPLLGTWYCSACCLP